LANFFASVSHRSDGSAGGFVHRVSSASDGSADALSRRSDAIGDVVHNVRGLVGNCLIVILFH
jgi:hypothetical protein